MNFPNSPSKLIVNLVVQLRKQLTSWNFAYYNLDQPIVPDAVYDVEYLKLIKLEKKYPTLFDENSPTQIIGWTAPGSHFLKVAHQRPMYSLANAFSATDLHRFESRVNKQSQGEHHYVVQPKIDGLSISIVFRNNQLHYGATRGNGVIGENITLNLKNLPALINFKKNFFLSKNFELRGEAYIAPKDFEMINEKIWMKQISELQKKFVEIEEIYTSIIQKNKIEFNDISRKTTIEKLLKNTNFKKQSKQISLIFTGLNLQKLTNFCQELTKKFSRSFFKVQSGKSPTILFFSPFRFTQIGFMNPRNMAAGSLRQKKSIVGINRKVQLVFYDLFLSVNNPLDQEKIKITIQKMGFPTINETKFCQNITEVLKIINNFESNRLKSPYPLDGVVIKVNESRYTELLGSTEKYQHNAIAYKFLAPTTTTKILNIFSTVGRTGKITYNAKLVPIFLDGAMISATSLHNFDYVQTLDLRIGDTVEIKKAGDVIPQIVKVVIEQRPKQTNRLIPSQNCPNCETKLIIPPDGINQFCPNKNCAEQEIKALIYFASRSVANIIGLANCYIRLFYQLKFLKKPSDFFQLIDRKKDLLTAIDAGHLRLLGLKSLTNIFVAIENCKQISWSQILAGMNIRFFGGKMSRLIGKEFPTPIKLFAASIDDFAKIDHVGSQTATALYVFFQILDNRAELVKINNYRFIVADHAAKIQPTKFWFKKKVVITGTFPLSRIKISEMIIARGGEIFTSINAQTSICLVGESPGNKLEKAQKLNVKIIKKEKLFLLFKLNA